MHKYDLSPDASDREASPRRGGGQLWRQHCFDTLDVRVGGNYEYVVVNYTTA